MGGSHIRPYNLNDLPRVLEIWEEAARTAHPFLPESFIVSEREQVREVYIPMAATWVFEDDGRVVGFISLVGDDVGGLFVEPSCHRRGIGRALLDFALAKGRPLELEVFEENSPARAFYERCGFVDVSDYLHAETGHRMVRMRSRAAQADPRAP
jgi:putative acetyltransferase